MKPAILESGGKLELREVPLSEPAAGEILVRVAACGICHTDLHYIDHSVPCPSPKCYRGREWRVGRTHMRHKSVWESFPGTQKIWELTATKSSTTASGPLQKLMAEGDNLRLQSTAGAQAILKGGEN